MRFYIGIVHKDPDSDFGISFPDFPGCVSAGATLDEAIAMGREALEGHISLMADEGQPIPEPSGAEQALQAAEAGGIPVLIPAPAAGARAVRVNITLPEDTLRQIDSYAEAHGFTRSGFLLTAARQAMRAA